MHVKTFIDKKATPKSVLFKAPIQDILHRGSAIISIVVVEPTRDQSSIVDQISCANWALKVSTKRVLRKWLGRLFHPGTILVCQNTPEAVLSCSSPGCTSADN